MALTYKSTGTTEVIIIEKDSDGTRRIGRAIQDSANPSMWRAQLEHPSGTRPCSNVYGSRGDASLALSHYLHETEADWRAERARGHRPEQRMRPDHNVPLDENGNAIGGDPKVKSYI